MLGKRRLGDYLAARETVFENDRFQMLSNKGFCLDLINKILEQAGEKRITKKDFHTMRVKYAARKEKLAKSIAKMKQQIHAMKKIVEKKKLEKGYVLQKIQKIVRFMQKVIDE